MASWQQTLEQRRAAAAWKRVHEEVKQEDKDFQEDYRALVRSAATDIRVNGLGQTLAFLLAKDKDKNNAYGRLYLHLATWLLDPNPATQVNKLDDKYKLMERYRNESSATDRWLTLEAMAYLTWLKRFAEADLDVPSGGKG